MNKFNNIIITGNTGSGKSMLAGIYMASHQEARLIDGLRLNGPDSDISGNRDELEECHTLIVDEIPYPPCRLLSEILKSRIRNGKNNIILTQGTENIEHLNSEDTTEGISTAGILLSLSYGADLEALCSCIDIMLSIRSDRPLEFNLWKYRTSIYLEDQDYNLSVAPREWNSLISHSLFWELLLLSNLQCLAENDSGEDMENGSVSWDSAKKYLEEFIQDAGIPEKLRNTFKEILSWVNTPSSDKYELGINFISSSTTAPGLG